MKIEIVGKVENVVPCGNILSIHGNLIDATVFGKSNQFINWIIGRRVIITIEEIEGKPGER